MTALVHMVDGSCIRFTGSSADELNEVLKTIPFGLTIKAFKASDEAKSVLVNWDNVMWIEDVE